MVTDLGMGIMPPVKLTEQQTQEALEEMGYHMVDRCLFCKYHTSPAGVIHCSRNPAIPIKVDNDGVCDWFDAGSNK